MSQREAILARVRDLPDMPASAVMVSKILRGGDVELSEVEKAINYDPGLTANVLRLANSAYFAGPKRIGSIKQAIIRLGINRIYNILIASSVAPMTKQAVKGYDLSPGDLWRHSVSTAIGVEEVASVLEIEVPDIAFTAGLLHDLGKIILGTFVEIDAKPIMNLAFEEGLSFEEAENRILGIDHAEVGAYLLQHWQLPQAIVDVVRWHQQPENLEGEKTIVDLVHVADALSMIGGIGAGSDGLNYRVSEGVVERLGMNIKLAEAVFCKVMANLEETVALFSADSTE